MTKLSDDVTKCQLWTGLKKTKHEPVSHTHSSVQLECVKETLKGRRIFSVSRRCKGSTKEEKWLRRSDRAEQLSCLAFVFVGIFSEDVFDDDDGLLHDVVDFGLDQLNQRLHTLLRGRLHFDGTSKHNETHCRTLPPLRKGRRQCFQIATLSAADHSTAAHFQIYFFIRTRQQSSSIRQNFSGGTEKNFQSDFTMRFPNIFRK